MYKITYHDRFGTHKLSVDNDSDLIAMVITLELSATVTSYQVIKTNDDLCFTTVELMQFPGLNKQDLSKNLKFVDWSTETNYMIMHTDDFMNRVFHDEPNYAAAQSGMVSAHGDKVEQYRDYWNTFGLSFIKAQVIYFLTYTKLMDMPKHKSKEWVVENYATYKDMLP